MATENVTGAGSVLPEGATWAREATLALLEAQVMSESIGALLEILIENSDGESFPLLEAIGACLIRMDRSVHPAVANAPEGARHE